MRTTSKRVSADSLRLPGLDGANPLGFLAAVGLFRIVSLVMGGGQARMHWSPGGGTWIPNISGVPLDESSMLDLLSSNLASRIEDHPTSMLQLLATVKDEERREVFDSCARNACSSNRVEVDWLAALASDAASSGANNILQATRRDYRFGNLKSVIERSTRNHLRRAIFVPWDYADALENQSMHLDPGEDRRHAYQWNMPAGDPTRKKSGGMLGANRLAIEALSWFTSLPKGDKLETIGFTQDLSQSPRWTWPIWSASLHADVVRSTFLIPELQKKELSAEAAARLRQRGIVAVFRTSRILVQKTPNFTPPKQIA